LLDARGTILFSVTTPDHLADINSCESLFLRYIGEPQNNVLQILVEEAITSATTSTVELGRVSLAVRAIQGTDRSRIWEMVWEPYVSYSVRNESYASEDEAQKSDGGRHFRIYLKSHFLDFVSRATFATAEYPGQYRHMRVSCEDHVVDVASVNIPAIRLMELSDAPQNVGRSTVFRRSP
jgi:hypothetical protein